MDRKLSRPLQFNHVAMSMHADQLDVAGRKEIVDFYHDAFGWFEHESETEDRVRLVMSTGPIDQFVFLIAEEEPMKAPRLDHFGFSVATLEDFDTIYDKVLEWRERDERVDVIEKKTEVLGESVEMTSFYVRHLLPMMIEVQHWKFLHH